MIVMRILFFMLMMAASGLYAQTQTVQKCAHSAFETTTTVQVAADTATVIPTITTSAGEESVTVPKPVDVPGTSVPTKATIGKDDE